MKERRILITGGTGFVGSHLVRYLKPSGAKLVVVSSNGTLTEETGIEYCRADIRNGGDITAAIRAASPDHIYHLAGISSVAASFNDPRLAFEVNVIGSYNVFEAAMRLPSPPRILNVSTAQVYSASDTALTETSTIAPDNPYAATKAMAELLAVQHRKSPSGGIITVRPFNHTGPGQLPDFVLPSFAKQLVEMEEGLRAPVLRVGNINVKRDFTDVRDVVVAYCKILEKGETGETYNVCSGRPILLAEIVREMQKNCGVSVKVEVDKARFRSGEALQMFGDPAKIMRATGWMPQIALEDTIKDLLDYWRSKTKAKLAEVRSTATESRP